MGGDSRSRAGEYYAPMPIDFTLLEKLPEKGTIGGVHWKGRRIRDLVPEIGIDGVDSNFVSARLRSMASAKEPLVAQFPAAGDARIWARTPAGSALVKDKDEILGDAPGISINHDEQEDNNGA
jgi:hypothetical protein